MTNAFFSLAKITPIAVALVATLTAVAPSAAAKAAAPKDTLRLGLGAEPLSLDPALASDMASTLIIDQIYEGLVTFDPITLAIKPGVAHSWTISDQGKTLTFKLRPTAKWSNGRVVTAMDFTKAWQRLLDPKTAARNASDFFAIVGAEEYYKSKAAAANMKANMKAAKPKLGFRALDASTLQIRLKAPMPHFMQMLTSKPFTPLPFPEFHAQAKNVWKEPQTLVTNGAYTLKSRNFQKDIVLTKNPNYWNQASVSIDKVQFKTVEDATVEENYFRTGKLDMSFQIPAAKAKQLFGKKDPKLAVSPFFATAFLSINTAKPPFDDPKVRLALSLAIDRFAITDKLLGTGQIPTKSVVPGGIIGYPAPKPVTKDAITADIATAKKLLAEAGYPDGKGWPKVTVLYHTHEDVRKLLVAIQSMWRKHLNISVDLYNEEWRVYLQNFKKKNYQIARAGWSGDFVDPTAFLNLFLKGDANNRTNWSNPEFESLLAKASTTLEANSRFSLLAKAEAIMLSEQPVIPLYQFMRQRLISPRVKIRTAKGAVAFAPNLLDTIYVKDLVLTSH